jgi:hypothetical protein
MELLCRLSSIMEGKPRSRMLGHELLHQFGGFARFVPLRLVVEDVDGIAAKGVAGDGVGGDEGVDSGHAVVFDLGDFYGVALADEKRVVEKGAVGGAFCMAA